MTFTAGELIGMALKMAGGVLTGRLRVSTIRALLSGMKQGERVAELYADYPDTEAGFDAWVQRADAVWASCITMADLVKDKA